MNPWVMAARPPTLTASIGPVVVGTAHAMRDGTPDWLAALACLAGAMLIQIATNFVNDVEDFERGADDEHRLGPPRAVERGLLTPGQVRAAAIGCFTAAAAVGCYLIYLGGWPILLLGVASILSGIAYTAGPFPLAYLGIGDLFVFLFFGLAAVAGTYFVQAQTVTWPVLASGAAIGALAMAILAVNNTRDVDNDQRAGKRTLAVRFGVEATRGEYTACLLFAAIVPLVLVSWLGTLGPLLAWIALPRAIQLNRAMYGSSGAALNPLLGQTAQLELAFAVLLSIGLQL